MLITQGRNHAGGSQVQDRSRGTGDQRTRFVQEEEQEGLRTSLHDDLIRVSWGHNCSNAGPQLGVQLAQLPGLEKWPPRCF